MTVDDDRRRVALSHTTEASGLQIEEAPGMDSRSVIIRLIGDLVGRTAPSRRASRRGRGHCRGVASDAGIGCNAWLSGHFHGPDTLEHPRMAIRIKARGGESAEQMLRRFKKLCEKEGLTKDVKKRQYYEKPSERNRREQRKREARVIRGGAPSR